MSKLITGIFPTRSSADRAVQDLVSAGFRTEDVSVLMPETDVGREFNDEKNTKAPEGAATGAAIGGVVGAVAAGLAAAGGLAGLFEVALRTISLETISHSSPMLPFCCA